jgi:hypothetical protein
MDPVWVRQQVNKIRAELQGDASYRTLEQRKEVVTMHTHAHTKPDRAKNTDENTTTTTTTTTMRTLEEYEAIMRRPQQKPISLNTEGMNKDKRVNDDEMEDIMAKYLPKRRRDDDKAASK